MADGSSHDGRSSRAGADPGCRPGAARRRTPGRPASRCQLSLPDPFVLVDVENLAGGHDLTAEKVGAVRQALDQVLGLSRVRRLIVGSHPVSAFLLHEAFPTAVLTVGNGRDGADLALLGRVDPLRIAARHRLAVVASGDHIFSGLALQLRRLGTSVVAVSRREALSAELAACVDGVVTVDLGAPRRRGWPLAG